MASSALSPGEHRAFTQWQNELFDLSNRFSISLVGLAARLKMRPDWSIDGVRLPNHLFYAVIEGAFEAKMDGVNRRLHPGDVLWASPDVPLWLRLVPSTSGSPSATDLVVLRFRLDAVREDEAKIAAPHEIQVFPSTPGALFLLERLTESAQMPASLQGERAVRAYLLALSYELERNTFAVAPEGTLTPAQCEAVRRRLAQARGEWPTPGDLARAAELSPPYFTRLFTRTFNRSPRRFLLEERMRLAGVRLLESSASVSQIARDLGYADVFAFSRQFKAVQGQSPTAFRAAHALDSLA